MTKYLRIYSYIRKPFLIYDFATTPFWISLYTRKIVFSFLSVYVVTSVQGVGRAPPTLTRLGWFFHHDGMYARNSHCHSVCTLNVTEYPCSGGGVWPLWGWCTACTSHSPSLSSSPSSSPSFSGTVQRAKTQYRKFETSIPRIGIARP